ncbi:MAG: nucleoside hydrolase [Oscillospiraceae bacterium]|nr:nucleoside hydrolase [Oscillospiraceae bacterium]MBQ6465329.1 nucleoside hydrolase [Oscillospiraceae bacterium]
MEKKKILLDCDPGHDDAVAIMLAAGAPSLELLGVTVESGNQTLEKTVRNTCRVLQWIGREDVPVYAGCDRPMVRDKLTAGDIHGETGLDGPVFPPLRKQPESEHAVSFLIRTLRAYEGDITVVTTGPMTNLAMALRLAPEIAEKIRRIVLMGGSCTNGNVSPAAEFNILADPEAAHVCFTAGRPLTMVGLDVTRRVLCTPEVVARMAALDTCASRLFVDLMGHFCRTQKAIFGWAGGPLHDPVTIAYLIDPAVLTTRPMNAQIDLSRGPSYGRTNCDAYDYLGLPATADVAVDIDAERFWDLVEEGLARYGKEAQA